MEPLHIALIVAGVILVAIVLMYNGLITKRNQVDNAFASIDVMLKKRADLIPQLVNTVKGYAKHEQAIFEKVTELRNKVKQVDLDSNERVDLENEITKGIGQIMITAEAYPDLKANENFLNLQRNISEQEEQLSAARRAFNASVNDYNNGIEKFPANILANMMSFKRKPFFELPTVKREELEQTPQVDI